MAGVAAGVRVANSKAQRAASTLLIATATRRYVARRLGCGECRYTLEHLETTPAKFKTELDRAWEGHIHATQIHWPTHS